MVILPLSTKEKRTHFRFTPRRGLPFLSATARSEEVEVSTGKVQAVAGGRHMARACLSDTLLRDLLCFCSLTASHPIHLAYLLFFSPYLLGAFSFLFPLLLSTCFLLLAFLTISPYFGGTPSPPDGGPSPPGPFGNTLRLVLDMLDPGTEGEPGVSPAGALCDIALELQACVDSVEEMYRERGEATGVASTGTPPDDAEEEEVEKRIVVAEVISSNEFFGWELEAISKLYKALTYEVEEFPIKLALRSVREAELLPPGIGFHGGDLKMQGDDPGEDLPRKEGPRRGLEGQDCKVPTCEAGDDRDTPLLGNTSKSSTKSRDWELPAAHGAASAPPAILKHQGISRSDSDGSRSGKLLRRSSSLSSVGGGLARVASAGERRTSGGSGAPPESLSSSGSMRKEKEWRRTLACKLYEERMIADGGEEGMDLLWEAYELGSGKDGSKGSATGEHSHSNNKGKKESKVKGPAKRGGHVEEEEEEEEKEEKEEEMVGRLCCLQALRFSTAKMGFAMGRPNLLRVSKAVKGIGVFRRSLRSSRKSRDQ